MKPQPANMVLQDQTRKQSTSIALNTDSHDEFLPDLIQMFAVMKTQGGDVVDGLQRAKFYAEDLRDLDPDDVQRAIIAFRRGDLGDGRFSPTPGEIRQAVKQNRYRNQRDLRDIPDSQLSNEQYWRKRAQLKDWRY